jgi:hypothetical protein
VLNMCLYLHFTYVCSNAYSPSAVYQAKLLLTSISEHLEVKFVYFAFPKKFPKKFPKVGEFVILRQGDQIRRIFVRWVIVHVGKCSENTISTSHFGLFFPLLSL